MYKYIFLKLILISSMLKIGDRLNSQCIEATQFPYNLINAPNYQDSIIVTNAQFAGDFYEVSDFELGKMYTFKTSASPADYITITSIANAVLYHGPSPLTVTINLASPETVIRVHISLQSPPCGNQSVNRISKIICATCVPANNVGIGTTNPVNSAKLDINSTTQGLKLPTMSETQMNTINDPVEGLIVYNTTKKCISHYNGTQWKSLSHEHELWISGHDFMPFSDIPVTNFRGYYDFVRVRNPYAEGAKVFYRPITLPIGSIVNEIQYTYYDNLTSSFIVGNLSYHERPVTASDVITNVIEAQFIGSLSGASSSNQTSSVFPNHTILSDRYYLLNIYFDNRLNEQGIVGVKVKYTTP